MEMTNGLYLFTSNRLEVLAEKLAERLRSPLSSPLTPEVIVVQSRGMERWVSLELARRHGICANMRYPFPKIFARELFQAALPGATDGELFDPDMIAWRIMKLLPLHAAKPAFTTLARYLEDDGRRSALKLFQLARRIAWVFDQYLIYRPEMILAWEKGAGGEDWQAELWRSLVAEAGGCHPAALQQAFLALCRDPAASVPAVPERVSVFGISVLPPYYLALFDAIARRTVVNLFLMNPTREFWGEITSDREIGRVFERVHRYGGGEVDAPNEDELFLERGNSLLASWGALGREFFRTVAELAGREWDEFVAPEGGTLLHLLQRDILELRDRGHEGDEDGRQTIAAADRSVQVHVCHSPLREVECLHDTLLDLFARDSHLSPRDILVMTPDIETYAPLVEAVFAVPPDSARGDEARRIPYSIADRNMGAEARIVRTLLDVLALAEGRGEASRVLGLLDAPALRESFALTEEDTDLIRRWVNEAGIRWGRDGEERRELGLPATDDNTWRWGLDRLLLGYALPGQEGRLFGGILPHDGIEGSDALVLGRFAVFIDALFATLSALRQPRSPAAWAQELDAVLDRFFRSGPPEELIALRRCLQELAAGETGGGMDAALPLDVVRLWLEETVENTGFGYGFLTGGVTFCALLPMRSIPAKMICLLGMNGTFPRRDKRLGFDLIAARPRPGDRSRRKDDRYLFLEALLSARETFIISYVGRSIRDDSAIPPSVVVSELLDYIEQGFAPQQERIVTEHRLQPFSPAYFQGTDLFSYSAEHCRAARSLAGPKEPPAPFSAGPLPEADAAWRSVALADLAAFLRHPARFFVRRRLRFTLPGEEETAEDVENFALPPLERYGLGRQLLEDGLAGGDPEQLYATVRASGRLPYGNVGAVQFRDVSSGVRRFLDDTRPYLMAEKRPPLDVDLSVGDFRLTGRIDGLRNCGRVAGRFASLTGKDFLEAWVYHLVLNCVAPEGFPRETMLLGREDYRCFRPLAEAGEVLTAVLTAYWAGLHRPLPLFPDASWKYADASLRQGKGTQEALRAARTVWEGNEFARGEGENGYFSLCFGKADPLAGEEFPALAAEVFGPLLAYQEKL